MTQTKIFTAEPISFSVRNKLFVLTKIYDIAFYDNQLTVTSFGRSRSSSSSCKMADGSQESAVISMLKELQDSMNSMKEENSHIKERLDMIENPNRGFRLGPRA